GATASNNTATTDPNGAATFSGLTLTGTVGSYTLSFGGTGITPVSSGPIALSAGAAASIAANGGGTSAPAGTAVTPPPAVIVKDAGGNPVSGVAVTFAASPGGGTTAPTTATAAAERASVGRGKRVPTAGTYTLSFGGTGITPVSSGAIALSAGAAASIAHNAGGASAPAGTAVTPPPSVIVKDASGNPVSGVAVTFAVAPGNGTVTPTTVTTG